ncbi:MAG: helix-turn-helix transcriptional regulator [Winogradskyella sp.]
MLNSSEFTNRLKKVIDFYDESASSFAEKIGVQRSSISHILSGRNKPSLDFVMKILHSYPEVELYWLLKGEGEFPRAQKQPEPKKPNLFEQPVENSKPNASASKLISNSNLESVSNLNSDIERIVIFYKNGSFKSYIP